MPELWTEAPGVLCDQCASGGKRCYIEPESGAYICEDCTDENRALAKSTSITREER